MGCTSSTEPKKTIQYSYAEKNLPMPDPSEYENEFEKVAYMTINLIRHDPKTFIPKVMEVKSKLFKNDDAYRQ